MTIRRYDEGDLDGMVAVWNEVVEAGDAFPQEEPLTGAHSYFVKNGTTLWIEGRSNRAERTLLSTMATRVSLLER